VGIKLSRDDEGEEIWEEEDWGVENERVLGRYPLLESVVKTALQNDGRISEEEWAIIETLRSNLRISKKVLERLLDEIRIEMGLATITPPEGSGMRSIGGEGEGVDGGEEGRGAPGREQENYVMMEVERESLPSSSRYSNIITPYNLVRGSSEPPLAKTFDFSLLDEDMLFWCPTCGVISAQEVNTSTLTCPHCGRPLKDLSNKEPSPTVEWLLKEAKKYFRSGNLHKARLLYNEVIKREPTNREAHFFYKKVSALINQDKKRKEHRVKVKFLKNVKWGIKQLDTIVGGGVKAGSQILITGPNYSGKEALVKSVTVTSLNMGFPLLYITTNRMMKEVVRELIPVLPGFSQINKEGLFKIYDLFSTEDEIVMKEGHRIIHLRSSEDLSRFRSSVEEALSQFYKTHGVGVAVFDSLTGIINRSGPKPVIEMLNQLLAKMKRWNITGIYLITPESHPPSTVNTLEYMMDGAIKIKVEGDRYFLRIAGIDPKIKTRDWIEYVLKEDKIHFVGGFAKELIR